MKHRIPLLLFAAIALIVTLWWILDGWGVESSAGAEQPAPSPRPDAAAEIAGAGAAAAGVAGGPAAEVESVTRREQAPPAEAAPEDERPMITLRGRCVAAESGEPLAGCEVSLHGWATNADDMAMREELDWEDPPSQTTGADGVFEMEFPDVAPWQYALTISKEGRITRRGRWSTDLTHEEPRDFGDVELARGARVHGRVVDEAGHGIAEARVYLEEIPGQDVERATSRSNISGTSDESGGFELYCAVPPGTWPLDVRKKGLLPAGPETVTVEQGSDSVEVVVRMKAARSVTGTVRLPDGQPVEGARVTSEDGVSGWMATDRTDESGRFRIHATNDLDTEFSFMVEGKAIEAMRTEKKYRWGDRNVVLTVREALSLPLTVVEAGSGDPVEEYAVSCHRVDERNSLYKDKRLGGRHEGGTVELTSLFRGPNVLRVVPWDEALRVSDPLHFEVRDGAMEPLVVEVERMKPLRVRLVGPGGEPVSGYQVQAVDRPGEGLPWVLDPRSDSSMDGHGLERLPQVLSTDETGSDGLARLHFPPSLDEGGLWIEGGGAEFKEALIRPLEQPQPIEVVVGGMGTVRGTVLHSHAAEGSVSLLWRRSDKPNNGRHGQRIEVAKDGSFESELAAGPYSVFLQLHQGSRGWSSWASMEPALDECVVEHGETLECKFDARHFESGSLSGRILLDGEPLPKARFRLRWQPAVEDPGYASSAGEYFSDERGEFEIEELNPGRYRLILQSGREEQSWKQSLRDDEEFLVAAGEAVEREFRFRFRSARIRVVHHETGEPLAGAVVHLGTMRGGLGRHATDGGGWLEISPLPSNGVRLTIFADNGRLVSELITFPENEGKEIEREVVMRPPEPR